jgi:hypothetical protein
VAGRETGTALVVADDRDETADRVCTVLRERAVPVFRFDTADFPGRVQLHAVLNDGMWTGHLSRHDERLDLAGVRSVFLRRPRPFEVPAHLTVTERWHAATESRYGLGGVLVSLPVPYVNHPSASADAYKPRQLRICGHAG